MNYATLIAPALWAAYLVNNDATGLERNERRCVDAWLASRGVCHVLAAQPHGFAYVHDARRYSPFGADCLAYSVVV